MRIHFIKRLKKKNSRRIFKTISILFFQVDFNAEVNGLVSKNFGLVVQGYDGFESRLTFLEKMGFLFIFFKI